MSNVIFLEHLKPDGSFIAEIKLNRTKSLNALDFEMIISIKNQLNKWKNNSNLSAVFLHGEGGKAFCVGGDIKSIYSSIVSAKNKKDIQQGVQPFFENEYKLDYLIHTYPCPVIVWGHGFVIGGGAGLFLAGSHRIATACFSLSMPEVTIGLFPDVGSSYILSRFPKELGLYIALTAYRLNHKEAQYLNIVDFYFDNSQKQEVFKTLVASSFTNKQELTLVLNNIKIQNKISVHDNWIKKNEDKIASLCGSKNLKNIYTKLYNSPIIQDKKGEKNQKTFLKSSPTSAGIACELLKRAQKSDLKQVFKTDLIVALNCVYGLDFTEGVRALLVEKTLNPQWNPALIEQIQEDYIQKYFIFDFVGEHPLNNL